MQKQIINFEFKKKSIKSLENINNNESFSFKGYASTFNNIDSYNDIILKGAFIDCITSLNSTQEKIRILWQHDSTEPIGLITKMQENDHGLYVEGEVLKNIQKGQELYNMIQNNVINSLSIGFIVKKSFTDKQTNIRYIEKIDLIEISFVTFPANKLANIELNNDKKYDLYQLIKLIKRTREFLMKKTS